MVMQELLSHITSHLLHALGFANARDTAQFVCAQLVIVDRLKPDSSV